MCCEISGRFPRERNRAIHDRAESVSGLFRVLAALGAAYVGYAALVFLAQRSLLYPGRSRGAAHEAAEPAVHFGPDLERHWLDVSGNRVETWLLRPIPAGVVARGPAALWFHGNGELIDDWPELLGDVRRLGLTVLLVEFPGYGRSSGEPTEATITEAAIAAYDFLVTRHDVDPARIVAFGRSLGAGAACAVAKHRPVAALVLHSAFTSVRPFAKRYFVPGFLARDVFDNRRVVEAYGGPVLVLHGRRDEVVPYPHGAELARAARDAELVSYETTHNDFPVERLAEDLGSFLRRRGVLAAAPDSSTAD